VSAIDKTLVSDYDRKRRRVRLRSATTKTRRALWIELHPVLADAIEATLPSTRSAGGLRLVGERDPDARLFAESGADALRTSIAKACRAKDVPLFSPRDLPAPEDQPASSARRPPGRGSASSWVSAASRSRPTRTRTSSPTRARSTTACCSPEAPSAKRALRCGPRPGRPVRVQAASDPPGAISAEQPS